MNHTNRFGSETARLADSSGGGLERKLLALLVAIALTMPAIPVAPAVADSSTISTPVGISIAVAPRTLPADGGSYGAVFVSLMDKGGLPTLALNSTTVFLTSSVTSVAILLNSSVVIGAGKGYAVAYVETTATPGQSTITGSTGGLTTAIGTVLTAVPTGYPTRIVVEAVPPAVPSLPSYTGKVVVELEDQAGLPAKATQDTTVQLLSSNSVVLGLSGSVTIGSGEFTGLATFFTGPARGTVSIIGESQGYASGSAIVDVSGSEALALKLYALPQRIVACATCKGKLVIALTDSAGNPVHSAADLVVQIRSSNTNVVNSTQSVTIPKGNISASVDFAAPTQGKAVVTASAGGLSSDFVNVNTNYALGAPDSLALWVAPQRLPADDCLCGYAFVTLLNKTGFPTLDVVSHSVVLTSSHAFVANFSNKLAGIDVNVGSNATYGSAALTSTFVVGDTALTVSSQNLNPSTGTLSTIGFSPSQIVLSPLSNRIPADGAEHPAFMVLLLDSGGHAALAPSDLLVRITAANGVVQVPPQVVIPSGRTEATLNATTGTASGTANVSARLDLSSGLVLSSSALVTTVTPAPSSVAATTIPSRFVLSKGQPLAFLVLQLQDASGNPARARQDTALTVTSSSYSVFNKTLSAKIAQGQDLVYAPLNPIDVGDTQFTVSSAGLVSSSVPFEVLAAPFQASLSPTRPSILNNETDLVQLSVSFEGAGLAGANVTWSSSSGSFSPAATATDTGGRSSSLFTPSATGEIKVTAIVTHPAVGDLNLTYIIGVHLPPPKKQASILDLVLTQAPYLHVPYVAFAGVAAVFLIIILLRRRKPKEEVVGEGFEASVS